MKLMSSTLLVLFVILAACTGKKNDSQHEHSSSAPKADAAQDTVRKSIYKEAHAQVGNVHVTMTYHAPAVRGRTIWGGLVPYGEVWVTGAHNATTLEFDKDIIVNEVQIPAGKYALFTIPGKESWTVIINKNWDQHLTDEYDEKEDLVRLTITPERLPENQERLTYRILADGNAGGKIEMSWDRVRVSVPFSATTLL